MKFSKLYEELKFGDVFKAATPEEVADRKAKFDSIKPKEILDVVKKSKLSDGSWRVHEFLSLRYSEFSSLEELNVSIVDSNFDCGFNYLTSLKGGPIEVDGYYCADCNNILTLEGFPKIVRGDFYLQKNNNLQFKEKDIRAICDVKGKIVKL